MAINTADYQPPDDPGYQPSDADYYAATHKPGVGQGGSRLKPQNPNLPATTPQTWRDAQTGQTYFGQLASNDPTKLVTGFSGGNAQNTTYYDINTGQQTQADPHPGLDVLKNIALIWGGPETAGLLSGAFAPSAGLSASGAGASSGSSIFPGYNLATSGLAADAAPAAGGAGTAGAFGSMAGIPTATGVPASMLGGGAAAGSLPLTAGIPATAFGAPATAGATGAFGAEGAAAPSLSPFGAEMGDVYTNAALNGTPVGQAAGFTLPRALQAGGAITSGILRGVGAGRQAQTQADYLNNQSAAQAAAAQIAQKNAQMTDYQRNYKNALLASLLQNVKDVNLNVPPDIAAHMGQISGGLRPSAFGAGAGQIGSTVYPQALNALKTNPTTTNLMPLNPAQIPTSLGGGSTALSILAPILTGAGNWSSLFGA